MNPRQQLIEYFSRNSTLNIHDKLIIIKHESPGLFKTKYVCIKKAPPILNIAFEGGAAKGMVLPGVIKALENSPGDIATSMRSQIRYVAGSSIGAIMGALFACGMSASNIMNFIKTTDFKDIRGRRENWVTNDNEFIRKLVENLLADLRVSAIDTPLTFKKLQTLSDADPDKYKQLDITITNADTGESIHCNAETTPDLPISLACQATSSMPVLFYPVSIPKRYFGVDENGCYRFIDGGYYKNLPVDTLQHKQQNIPFYNLSNDGINLHTLAFVYDEYAKQRIDTQSVFLNATHKHSKRPFKPTWFDRLIRDSIPKYFGTIPNTTKTNSSEKANELANIQACYTQRCVPINTQGIRAKHIVKAKEEADKLFAEGEEATNEYFRNHQGEYMYHAFNSISDLIASLSPTDHGTLNQYVEQPATSPTL